MNNYFNMYNINLESKIDLIKLRNKRRLSSHKIYVSKGEFKHTNSKVIINIYLYNRQKYNYLYKINRKKIIKRRKKKISLLKIKKQRLDKIRRLEKKNIILKTKTHYLKQGKYFIKKQNSNQKKTILKTKTTRKYFFKQAKLKYISKILRVLKKKQNLKQKKIILKKNLFSISLYNKIFKYSENTIIKNITKKYIYEYIINLYYKRLLILNELKFKYTYANKIINIFNRIYNKATELNIVDLKNIYLNSTLLGKFIQKKTMKKLKKLNRLLKLSVNKVKIKKKNNSNYLSNIYKLSKIKKIKANNIKKLLKEKNTLSFYKKINKIYKKNFLNYKIKYKILNSIKNKYISGIKIIANGRLSNRSGASKSVQRFRSKGNLSLKNFYDKNIKFSSLMIRNSFRSNIEYTNLNSTIRTGSFGIKS